MLLALTVLFVICIYIIQPNFNGSNTFGTMKICSRQGLFELMSVKHSAWSEGLIGISFRFFFNMTVCCVYSLESPHWGDSAEYIQHTIFNMKRKIALNHPKSAAMSFLS